MVSSFVLRLVGFLKVLRSQIQSPSIFVRFSYPELLVRALGLF